IQCLPDIIRRALFTRMSDGQEPVSTGLGKDPFELAGRMAELRTIKPNGKESVPIGQRLSERLESIVLSQVPQKAQDQPAADTQLLLAISQRCADPLKSHLEWDAPFEVRLRIIE